MIETKFKHTDIGLVPVDWEVKKLSDITNVVTGGTPRTDNSSFWGGNIRWMNSGELNLKFVYDVEGRITEDGYNHSSTQKIPSKCVLIGLAGQGKTRGTAAFNLVPLCINQSIGAIIPNKDFDPLYMYYQIDNRYQELRILSSGDGGRGGLNKQILLNLNIVLPSISEQQRIASALMNIDALISNLDKLIAKKQALKKGAMQELLTGKKRLPGFKGEWKKVIIDEVCNRFDNLRVPVAEALRIKGDTPYYGANGIQDFVKGFTHKGEFILIAEDGANNLSDYPINYVNGKIWVNNHAHVLQAKEAYNTRYLSYAFKRINIEEKIVGSGRAKLNASDLMSLSLRIALSIDEQHAIAHVLSTMDSDISLLEQKRDKYRQIKQGMMRDLLTGRIRLIDKDSVERKSYTVGLQDRPFDGAIAAEPSPQ